MSRLLLLLLFICLFACNNLEDATVPERNTFIRFFGSPVSYSSVTVERDLDGGYILAGNVTAIELADEEDPQTKPGIILIKTNNQGNKMWEKIIRGANVHSIKPIKLNTEGNGYLLTGDGIELNPRSNESSEFVNTQFLLLKLNEDGDIVDETTGKFQMDSSVTVQRGAGTVTLKVDFKGMSSTFINGVGGEELVSLGSYKVPGGQERTIIMGFDPSDFSTPKWRKNLDLQNFDYVSTNFLGVTNGNLIWTSTATPTNVDQSRYMSVITVPPNHASPANNSLFGKFDTDGAHKVSDIQPSATGFGAIGTFTDKSGNMNVFFVKVDPAGNVASTANYFDCAGNTGDDIVIDRTKSEVGFSQDEGTAITYTKDGGFILACSMQQTPSKGNGGTDIVLIKIDAFGNYKWDKLMGGSGNEVATSIRELPDGSLLIAGTSTVSNISSMFIIRADANGELKD